MSKVASPRCTVQRSGQANFCDEIAMVGAPFPICARHAVRLFECMTDALDQARRDPLLMLGLGVDELERLRAKAVTRPQPRPQPDPVVYYLLIDGLVKIGYATDFRRRLTAYPPTTQVLATEPGTRALESDRLLQFAEYLTAGREWFTPGPRLREHIEGLADYRAA